jgi:hypothetical protein
MSATFTRTKAAQSWHDINNIAANSSEMLGSEKIKSRVASNFVCFSPGIVLYLVSSVLERKYYRKDAV